jgi:hypothetical protein
MIHTFPRAREAGAQRETGIIPGRWIVSALGFSCCCLLLILKVEKLQVAPLGLAAAFTCGALTLFICTFCRFRAPATRIGRRSRDAAEYFGVFIFMCLLGAFASYSVAAATNGYSDHYLLLVDRHLGFDWPTLYSWVAAHPLVRGAGRMAYESIFVTPAVLLAYYASAGAKAEARMFIASFWVASMVTLVCFVFMPARGPLAVLWHGPIPYMPISALYQAQLLPVLRRHQIQQIHLEAIQGVVCAPSFHAGCAVLFIAAAWRVKPLRWPLLALNGAMLLATPVEGTHYLTDIIAGALVAAVSVWAVRRLCERISPPPFTRRGSIRASARPSAAATPPRVAAAGESPAAKGLPVAR